MHDDGGDVRREFFDDLLDRGSLVACEGIRTMSRRLDVRLKVFIVQPGLSKAKASESQLRLLAVTERYLSDTYGVPLGVICSA